MVSIIIPIYNAAQWLHRSVESVLRQDYSDWELILVDDGSSDESLQKCEAYSSINNRIKVLHQDNQGVTAARYTGFLQAKGEYVYFLDSDDSLILNALSLLTSYQKRYGADVVKCTEAIVVGKKEYSMQNQIVGLVSRETYLLSLIKASIVSTLHATLYKKRLFDENIFNIERRYKLGEDVLMNVMIANRATRFYISNDVIYHYYYNEESALQTQVMSFEYNTDIADLILHKIENVSSEMCQEMKNERMKCIINYFFVPEFSFSKNRYEELIVFFSENPNLKSKILERVNRRYVKFIEYKFLYRIYTFVYRQYILWFKQNGKKKKIIY